MVTNSGLAGRQKSVLISALLISLFAAAGIIVTVRQLTMESPEALPAQLTLDQQLSPLLIAANVAALDIGPAQNEAQVALGEALFFDPILSGNQDISCATCHDPRAASGDGLSLSVGTGGSGVAEARQLGEERELIPRNAPEIFNRGAPEWRTMFWDGRVSGVPYSSLLQTPADDLLPAGLASALAAQALFPPTSRDEMRGEWGDDTIHQTSNELALVDDDELNRIWDLIMIRLLAIPEYVTLFNNAYPDVATEALTIAHMANAIAAFEIAAFSFDDSPWDDYLRGNEAALSEDEKEGALLFFGKANCASCHNGMLLTDQNFYNLGIPQFGPGKTFDEIDPGRAAISQNPSDRFAFRTPPLRNVTLTGPWMHNGAYASLEAVIRHHLDPAGNFQTYSGDTIPATTADSLQRDRDLRRAILIGIEPRLMATPPLNDDEIELLLIFLETLTAPEAVNLAGITPQSVPSGLAVSD